MINGTQTLQKAVGQILGSKNLMSALRKDSNQSDQHEGIGSAIDAGIAAGYI
jgi:hypothetical protein